MTHIMPRFYGVLVDLVLLGTFVLASGMVAF